MDFDLIDIEEQNAESVKREKRLRAKELYQSYSNINKFVKSTESPTATSTRQNPSTLLKEAEKDKVKPEKSLSDEDSLHMLKQLTEGKSLLEIHQEFQVFRQYQMKKMHNLFTGTLQKLCRTFFKVLPNGTCQLNPKKYQETHLKNPAMLVYYNSMGLNTSSLFEKLIYIKNWQKQYSDYLTNGFGGDYLPENVVSILGELPDYLQSINYLFDQSHFSSAKPQTSNRSKEKRVLDQKGSSHDSPSQ